MITRIGTIVGPITALSAALTLSACDAGVGMDGPQNVALNFRVGSASGPQLAPHRASGSTAGGASANVAGPPMVIMGSNGTLTIAEIRLIVAEVELEAQEGSCDAGQAANVDCTDFEALPRFLDLPLDGQPIEAFVGLIPAGTYEELEFEIEDLEDDEEDEEFAAEIAALRDEIVAEFPDWPRKASALVVGSFESSGVTTNFRVYIDAEIEIERELIPNLVVGVDGVAALDLTVDVRPDIWFTNPDGTVLALQLYDWDATGELLEFEFEMENGFEEIEIESR